MDEKILQDLHNAVANELLHRVVSGECQASDLNVARQFLKDNGIEAGTKQSEPMANLTKILPFNVNAETA